MSLLDARLQAVLSLIPAGSTLLDIGTDHCKLPAEGLLCGKLSEAFAADIRQGPLDAAARQLASLGLFGKIPLYLSDGLKEIPLDVLEQVTTVAVAGMGGEVTEQILKNAPIEPICWVLQPMSAIYELLDFLAAEGYEIADGKLAQDGEKFYRIFQVQKTGIPYEPDYFSMIAKDPLYRPYLQKEQARLEQALAGLRSARIPDEKRIAEAETLLSKIRKAMP
ncbi:MAG: SAM-dependent methyltransferase [Clostridia bacterium]|nr:SAM-dependent methyltransferase [Clostridia bacterium]